MRLCRLVFPCFVGIYLRTSVILHGLISFRNSSRLPWQLSVRFYSMARSRYISPEKWGGSEFACFVRLSIVFFECYFKPFLCLLDVKKPKNLGGGTPPPEPPPGPCYGSATGLTAARGFQTPSCFALRAFHAHIVWASPALPMSIFFFSINPCEYSHLKFWSEITC